MNPKTKLRKTLIIFVLIFCGFLFNYFGYYLLFFKSDEVYGGLGYALATIFFLFLGGISFVQSGVMGFINSREEKEEFS